MNRHTTTETLATLQAKYAALERRVEEKRRALLYAYARAAKGEGETPDPTAEGLKEAILILFKPVEERE